MSYLVYIPRLQKWDGFFNNRDEAFHAAGRYEGVTGLPTRVYDTTDMSMELVIEAKSDRLYDDEKATARYKAALTIIELWWENTHA